MEVGAFGVTSELEQLKRDRFALLKEVMRLRNQEAQTAGEPPRQHVWTALAAPPCRAVPGRAAPAPRPRVPEQRRCAGCQLG